MATNLIIFLGIERRTTFHIIMPSHWLINNDNRTLSHLQLWKLWWCRVLADAHAIRHPCWGSDYWGVLKNWGLTPPYVNNFLAIIIACILYYLTDADEKTSTVSRWMCCLRAPAVADRPTVLASGVGVTRGCSSTTTWVAPIPYLLLPPHSFFPCPCPPFPFLSFPLLPRSRPPT